ncbi:MAG: TonB-dependent receptor [Myxococcota bacterium]
MSFLLLFVWAFAAFAAGDAEEAEIEFRLGLDAYTAGQYDLALSRFLSSNRLAPNPAVAFNIARCYAKTERFAESYRWYGVAAQSLDDPEAVRQVEQGLEAVRPRVVVYELTSDPPGADVYIDSKDFGVIGVTPLKYAVAPMAEGHTFVFTKVDHQEVVVFDVAGGRGQTVPVTATLTPIAGTAVITGPDGAEVFLGAPTGPKVCVTPCEAPLPPGSRILYVRKDGFRDTVLQLDIQADRRTETTVTLVANTGSVLVQSSERGSLVEVDGVAAGFTPAVVRPVPVGSRVVRVSAPGFTPVERTVTVETDQQVELTDLLLVPADDVTAVSRRPETASLAPSSLTVITRAEIEAFRYPTLYEALRGVRGFAMTDDSLYGTATIRGLGQTNDYNNKLLMLIDGATVNDNFGSSAYLLYDGMVDTDAVERLEVVRGPGSVLYGAGAVSGVLNVVGRPRDPTNSVTIRGGGFDRAFFGTGRVSHGAGDGFGIRAELSGAASQGRDETIDPRGAATPPIDVDGVERFEAYTSSGRMWFGEATTAQWFVTSRKQYVPTGAFTTNFGDSDESYWTDQRAMVELRYEPKLSDATGLFTRVFGNGTIYEGSFPIGEELYFERGVAASTGAELRLITEPSDAIRLQLGSSGTLAPMLDYEGTVTLVDGTDEPYLDLLESIYNASAFGVLDLKPSKLLALSLGVRGDYWSTFGFAPSPRVALVTQPTDRDVLKLIAGRAFRAPSLFELAFEAPDIQVPSDFGGRVLSPETVWSGEAEYTHRFGTLWTLLLAGHGSLAQDLIETQPLGDGSGLIVYENSDGAIRTMGADAELRRAFQGGVLVSAFYSWLDARYENELGVENAPIHHAAFKVVFPIAAPDLRLAARANLEGTRLYDAQHDARTGLATIVDVVASGKVPALNVAYAVGVYNALDTDYEQPLGDTFPLRAMPQPGRSLMFDLSKSF